MAYEALNSLLFSTACDLDFQKTSCSSSSDDEESCSDGVLLRKKIQSPRENAAKIQSLRENAAFLSHFIEDFPREAANLEPRLTNAAKKAEHTFNIYLDENGWKYNLSSFRRTYLNFYAVLADPRWEEAIEEIVSLGEEAKVIKNSSKSRSCLPRRATVAKETLVGFEESLIEMKSRVCSEPSSQLEIVPIIGMGGIGKTTLARYIYEEPLAVHHFDVRAWETVSQNSSAEIILLSLLISFDPSSKFVYKFMAKEVMVVHVHKYLKNRRYLIVMDDMWDTNVWDDVRMAFPDDCNGSRIIITTRDLDVASYVDFLNKPHKLELMSVDQSWRLLKEGVFGQENCPPQLEKIGKKIAERCKGLPLAIVVMAGVLSKFNQMQESWEKIARNVSEAVTTSSDEHFFSDILSVSYMHLPTHLRPCFLYTACFPEDYEINVSRLIRLWAAEGFLTSNESKDMEELGYEYLEELARRSLVLIEKKRYDGKIKTVKIHDVLRDLCIRKSRDENFLHVINIFEGSFPQGIENSNRLSICSNISGVIPNMETSPIHTILLFKQWAFDSWKSFRLLKVVHALSVQFTLSRCNSSIRYIGELIQLRYLALTSETLRRTIGLLSESLYQLQNLQILIVVVDFPSYYAMESLNYEDLHQSYMEFEIWRMPQLRHLILWNCFIPEESSQQISPLENLQTLSHIQDFKCSERVLQMTPNLKKLKITYSYKGIYETGWSEYSLDNLVHLHKLENLSIHGEPYPNLKNDVLSDNINFPETLKKLTLSGCRFPWEDMTMIGSLPNLQVLKLMRRACLGTKWETSEGDFCQLKVLIIEGTDLHEWISDDSSFPRLEHLTLYECESLRGVPNGIGDIPTLRLVEVDIRNLSVVESVKCIEEEQQSLGNDLLQVRFLKSRSWVRSKDWSDLIF